MEMHDKIVTTLTANDISVIDLLEPFTKVDSQRSSYALDGVHLNENGHRTVAINLVNELL
jgi:hypothetical protein